MTKNLENTLQINGRLVPIEGERNLLEVIRKSGIQLPTFCYHSDLSVYGACRLCLVDVEGRGLSGACSTPPEPGMKLKTNTDEIREIRKISVELLLANHDNQCPTCPKSDGCGLQRLAHQLGVEKVRYKPVLKRKPIDESSHALVRDPNKCVLCGDCVRVCREIQGIGAIDFAHRGHDAAVLPAFGLDMAQVECVNCGQCTVVCPTGALSPKPEMDETWKDLADPTLTVVAQVAPAVRVAIGEAFGLSPGTISTGQVVAALRRLGFKHVYDTAFAADLTVIEEGTELLGRVTRQENLPQFTSCCPAWVKYAEHFLPEWLPHLSTCRSPQQMFGALLKDRLPESHGIAKDKLRVVSVMPCTAKKYEARRSAFAREGIPDVDRVLTTQELARMIKSAGILFHELEPESFDMPFGLASGAGVLFANSGGVTEAALRFAVEKLTGKPLTEVDFHEVRGEAGLREATVQAGDLELRVAMVHGLGNAKALVEAIREGRAKYDFVEVMSCPGGCVSGAGQPVNRDRDSRKKRAKGIYEVDKTLPLHKSQENVFVGACYQGGLGEIGGPKAHGLLHTHYHGRPVAADDREVKRP